MRSTMTIIIGERPRRYVAAVLAAAALALAACGGDDGGGTDAGPADDGGDDTSVDDISGGDGAPGGGGGVLRVAHPTGPSSLDPAQGNSGFDHIYLYPMVETLIDFTPETLEATPGLAESWEFPDPQTLVLQLRDGVTFHDGTPLDADAVKYNLDRSMTWEHSNISGDLQNVDSVEVTGDLEVTVHLSTPDTALPLILADRAGMMVSPTAAEEAGADLGLAPVGTGPFTFDEWLTGDVVSMNRWDDYWGPAPSLDRIEFSIITDADTRINAMLSGEQDFTFGANPRDIERIEAADGLVADISPGLYHDEFYLNNGRPPFDDVRVRQAFNHAIDREALNEAKQYGAGEPAWLPLPSDHWAFPEELVPTYPYDPDLARELLGDAGYGDGLTIEVVGWSNDVDIRHAEIIQAQLSAVGITMEMTMTEVPQATAQFFDEKRFDAYLAAWTGRPDPSLTYSLLFSKDGYFNAAGLEVDGLEEQLRATREVDDLDERAEAFATATATIVDEALYVPLTFPPDFAIYTEALTGYEPNLLAKPKLAFVELDR